jgi:hypothetical protein
VSSYLRELAIILKKKYASTMQHFAKTTKTYLTSVSTYDFFSFITKMAWLGHIKELSDIVNGIATSEC